jgi:hypothetical protein
MFKISVEGETLEELASNLCRIATMYQAVPAGGDAQPAPKPRKSKEQPVAEEPAADEGDALSGEDAALEADLKAPVEPAPETSKTIVDAGTGEPAQPIKMTMDDVRAAAAKLAAQDTPKLGKILESYGAAKLSEVPKEKLGDFASDVMEALG